MSKIALITGANRGLGRNSALALAEDGVDLILTYRSNEAEAAEVLEAVRKLGRTAVAFRLDVGALDTHQAFADDVRRALRDQWGRDTFDFLVNNAGVGIYASIADTTVAQFDELLDVHLRGAFFLTQTLLPLLADGGRILNLSTGLARFTKPGYAAYALMKGAVEVFTRYLAAELGPRRITVNTLAPGVVATDFAGGAVRDTPAIQEALATEIALGRVGQPDDIGGVVAALLEGRTGFITGQRVEASGGTLL
ncbi:SDR family NAD(P)-dependent oxidoreductase [Cryptosporangium sp. NPDC051539]|uniref:SDR family NAD(P)-dependent oxidoreductase n=1 Tax=Cryptosporangium sp. NPDC051539 TaxID=3363962 RepID=UPI003791B63A